MGRRETVREREKLRRWNMRSKNRERNLNNRKSRRVVVARSAGQERVQELEKIWNVTGVKQNGKKMGMEKE